MLEFTQSQPSALASPRSLSGQAVAWIDGRPRSVLALDSAMALGRTFLEAMSTVVGIACDARTADASLRVAARAEFAIGDVRCELTLDSEACRAIVDAVTSTRVGLVGSGRLTQVERAVLEYVMLRTCERATHSGHRAAIVQVESMAGEPQVVHDGAHMTLRVGAREGRIALRGIGTLLKTLPPLASTAISPAIPVPSDGVDLHASLGCVPLTPAECARVREGVGDVLLLGATSFEAIAGGGLETIGGWRACDAVFRSDTDLLLSGQCGRWMPTVSLGALQDMPGKCAIRVLVGTIRCTPGDAAAWASPRRVDVELAHSPNVTLCYADRAVGTGILARAEGRLSVVVHTWQRNWVEKWTRA